MSTKLVRKQLESCLEETARVQKASSGVKKRRIRKLKKQAIDLQEADQEKTAKLSYEQNLAYFKATQRTQNTTLDMMRQDVMYHPAGAEAPLLDRVNFVLPANKMGLLIGRSGSGKTTLLQVLAGFAQQTAGRITLSPASTQGNPTGLADSPSSIEERMQRVGLVFQFPERHFLGQDVLAELTFGWPRAIPQRQQLAMRLPMVLQAVGMAEVPISLPPSSLSGGQQRRLALATQLVRRPSLLLLDEPLAGLDWKARGEVVELLRRLKGECTVLVVSHDLKEIEPLVDCAWRMMPGGKLQAAQWPPGEQDRGAWETGEGRFL